MEVYGIKKKTMKGLRVYGHLIKDLKKVRKRIRRYLEKEHTIQKPQDPEEGRCWLVLRRSKEKCGWSKVCRGEHRKKGKDSARRRAPD